MRNSSVLVPHLKAVVLCAVLIGLAFCATAQLSTNQPARLKTKVTSYEGKVGSGVCGISINFAPDTTYPGNGSSDTVTSAGHESELKWTFLGRNGDKDVYRFVFTRRMKADAEKQTTSSKEVSFDGKRIVIFEDELHCVVIESPSDADLKAAQKK